MSGGRIWVQGTYRPEALHARINELLAMVQARARADRDAGRLAAADEGDEMVVCVTEQMRWSADLISELQRAVLALHSEAVMS